MTVERLRQTLDRLYRLEAELDEYDRPRSCIARLSPAAKAAWIEFYDAHGEETASLTGDLAAAWSKLEETAARLALVFHEVAVAAYDPFADAAAPDAAELQAETLAAAIRVVGWFKRETRRVYRMLDETDEQQSQRQSDERLLGWISRRGGSTTARDACRGCRWLTTVDEAEEALSRLVELGSGEWVPRPAGDVGGRPTAAFVVSTIPAPEHLKRLAVSTKPQETRTKPGFVDVDTQHTVRDEAGEEAVEI